MEFETKLQLHCTPSMLPTVRPVHPCHPSSAPASLSTHPPSSTLTHCIPPAPAAKQLWQLQLGEGPVSVRSQSAYDSDDPYKSLDNVVDEQPQVGEAAVA